MMHAISVDSRRSPPSLYARTIRAGGPSNTTAARHRSSSTSSPWHSVQSRLPYGAPHRVQACAGLCAPYPAGRHRTPGTGRLATRAARGREQLQRLLGKLPQEPVTRHPHARPHLAQSRRDASKALPRVDEGGVSFQWARLLSRHTPIRSAVPQNRSRPPHPAWAYDASDGGASWAHPQRCQKSRRNGFAPLYLPHHPDDGAEP